MAGGQPSQTVQIGKVSYKRPETWSFWLQARLVGGSLNPGPGTTVIVCNVHLYLGVGRIISITKDDANNTGFVRFLWQIPPLVTPGAGNINNTKYTTRVRTPWLEDIDHASFELIDHLVAQDIQCEATVEFLSAPVGATVDVECTAMFAPRTHIRPDWYSDDEWFDPFKGGELGGT